jgi:hypothetical protein
MLIEGMRTMIDLTHRDDTQIEDSAVDKLRTDEQILQSQEQLKREYDDDDDDGDGDDDGDDDGDQIWDNIDSLDTQVADEEATKAMTNEEKELAYLFQKSLGTLSSAD